ncbi:MAG: serine/threonine protein kinase [Eubacteriales bacterium]
MAVFNSFIFANLNFVAKLGNGSSGEDTSLFLYEPTKKLYVVKKVDISRRGFYEKIAAIDSPYLAKILYMEESENTLSVVREYLSGDCLSDLLREKQCLPEQTAVKIAAQVCSGLSELHKNGLVHRDINPNNILITSDGNARIIDFGIVRSFEQKKAADTVILGTPGYAAPEQFGFTQSDCRTDIFAVGVLLNVMLTGKLPGELHARGSLGKIVDKCIQIDSDKRYGNMDELKNAVQNRVVGENCEGRADRFIRQIPGLRSRRNSVVVLSAIAYTLAIIFTVINFSMIKGGVLTYLLHILAFLASAVIPFFCFHNVLNIWDRLPFASGSGRRTKAILFRILGILSLIFGIMLFGSIPTT